MIEKVFDLIQTENKKIEKVVVNEHLNYMHVILFQNEGLPLHQSNANVYMTVVRGRLSISLNDDETRIYPAKKLLSIPYKT